jgi:hypothetical protein
MGKNLNVSQCKPMILLAWFTPSLSAIPAFTFMFFND